MYRRLISALAVITLAVTSCGIKSDKDSVPLIKAEKEFMKEMGNTSKKLSEIKPSALEYADYLANAASLQDDRNVRIAAQNASSSIIVDVVKRAATSPDIDSDKEKAALEDILNAFLNVHDQWIYEPEEQNFHLYKEIPLLSGRGSAGEKEDFFFVDYLIPSEEQPDMLLSFRFPDNASTDPVLLFVKYSEDGAEEIDHNGYDLPPFEKKDILDAPGSNLTYAGEEVLNMMMEYDDMVLMYTTADGEKEMGRCRLAAFRKALKALE